MSIFILCCCRICIFRVYSYKGILGSKGQVVLVLLHFFSDRLFRFTFPPARHEHGSFSTTLQTEYVVIFKKFLPPRWVKNGIVNCPFLPFFCCSVFFPIFTWIFVSLCLNFQKFMCISVIGYFSVASTEKIPLTQLVGYLLTLFMVYYVMQIFYSSFYVK